MKYVKEFGYQATRLFFSRGMTWFDALFRFSVVENNVDILSISSWKYLKDTLFIHFPVFFFLFRISIYVKKILHIFFVFV